MQTFPRGPEGEKWFFFRISSIQFLIFVLVYLIQQVLKISNIFGKVLFFYY